MVKGWDEVMGGSRFECKCGQKRKFNYEKKIYLRWYLIV